jgi:hypothetical protein
VYRHIFVCEVDDGYIARVFPGERSNLAAEGLALPISDVIALIGSQERARGVADQDVKYPPLCRTGYEDFFRSLGYELDQASADKVSLVELREGILVAFTLMDRTGQLARSDVLYDPAKIDKALADGYKRRRPSPPR